MGLPGEMSDYQCPECGNMMVYETMDSLVCENCGYGVDVDMYGVSQESYKNMYPTQADYLTSIGEYHGELEEPNDGDEFYDPEVDGMCDLDA